MVTREDDRFGWLHENKPKIITSGALALPESAALLTAFYNNARDYILDLSTLVPAGRTARAKGLIVICLEELGKIPLLCKAFAAHELGIGSGAWENYWQICNKHNIKLENMLSYGQIIRGHYEGDVLDRKLYRHYPTEHMFSALNKWKQSSFYVDFSAAGVIAPSISDQDMELLDYLVAFAQERLDSFAVWHVTERRSADMLRMMTGARSPREWTHHHNKNEIAGELIYRLNFHSASQIPDYSSAIEDFRAYAETRPDKFLEEAFLTVVAEIKRRTALAGLRAYHARTWNELKLLVSVSQNILKDEASKRVGEAIGLKETTLANVPKWPWSTGVNSCVLTHKRDA